MTGTGSRLALLLLAGSLCTSSGCNRGRTHNPSYFPSNLFCFGDIVPTHAKPGGAGYFSNYDPHAIRLEVRPKVDPTNPVRTQFVLIATVRDKEGDPRRKRRIEWLLEGVGSIMEVDESGINPGRGYKVNNKYAVSYTDFKEHTITRGNDNPNDDFTIRPGQSWCVISSAIEGDSHLTIYAPEINDWEKSKVYLTCHWVDANWIFPPSASVRAGTEHVLTTKILRHTDQKPLANYRVRYTVLEGPEAVFVPSRTREFLSITDLAGNAHATLLELAPLPGMSKIGIEVIRPPDPTSPSGTAIPIARGETTVEWLAPSVALTHSGPSGIALGQEAAFNTAVLNNGKVESRAMTVTSVIPDGLQYLRSTPPAFTDGKVLTWALGTLPPRQTHSIQAVYRALKPGPITSCASVQTEEGYKDEKCFTTQVTAPGLKMTIAAPPTGTVNSPIDYQITLTNTGGTMVENIVLTAQFEQVLEHLSKANPLQLTKQGEPSLASLAPGQSRTVILTLTPRQAGRLTTRVTVTADGGLADAGEAAVNVALAPVVPQPMPGKLTLAIEGPKTRFVGDQAGFVIRVANTGETPGNNVVVRDQLPPELSFVSADQGGRFAGNEVVWSIGALQPREQKLLTLTTKCEKITAAAVQQANATGDAGLRADAQAALEIQGRPGLGFKMIDIGDPVEVKKTLTYQITVTNTGTLVANQVEVKGIAPAEMKLVGAKGPGTVQGNIAGQVVTFGKLDNVEPGKSYVYTIEVEALKAGDVRFRAEMSAPVLPSGPVIETESTTIIAPAGAPKL